jgi:ATP-dependent RNA helicase DHX33
MIGAFDRTLSITPTGTRMATFPLDPHLARSLLESQDLGCTSEVLTVISLLSTTAKVLYDPSFKESREAALDARRKFFHRTGDHLTLLNIHKAYKELSRADGGKRMIQDWCRRHYLNERALTEAQRIRKQLHDLCARVNIDPSSSCGEETEPVLRSLLVGLAHNAASRQPDGTYKDISNGSVCCIFPMPVPVPSPTQLFLAHQDTPILNYLWT